MSWLQVRTEFEKLVDQPASARQQRLLELERTDRELAARLRTLLDADSKAATFLERTPDRAGPPSAEVGPGLRIGHFELVRLLGSGGMGSVWQARQTNPDRTVAIKLVTRNSPTDVERWRFQHEVQVLAALSHPSIATFFEAGTAQLGGREVSWLAMELVADAKDVLTWARERQLSRTARLELFRQLCLAVEHGHRRGVLHRDIKPSNVLVDGEGHLKLIDFGIARALGGEGQATGMHTLTGEVVGTVHYMAPEQLRGQTAAIGTASDVYALGVILYHLMCDRPPFDFGGLPLASIASVVLEREPIAPGVARADLPPDLGSILLRSLEKDPTRRYATVRELAEDIERFRSHTPVHARPPSSVYRLRKFVRRHRVGVAAGAVVFLVSCAALLLVASALQAERDGRQSAEVSLEFLVDVISSPDPDKDGRDTKMVDTLARAARAFDTKFVGAPQARAVLSRAIARTFLGLGLLPEAERHARTSITLRQECFGGDHEETASAEADLVGILHQQGRLPEADELLTQVEAKVTRLPPDHPLIATTALRRGEVQHARGDRQAAEATLRPVLAQRRETDPRAHSTLQMMNLLACILHERGDLTAAESFYREAMLGLIATKGEHHLDTQTTTQNLAMLLQSNGRFAEALPIVERVLAVRRERLGEAHKDTITSLVNVGAIHLRMGHLDDAVRWFDEALQAMGPSPDEKWDVYQVVLSNLAALERKRQNFPRALELGQRVLTIRQQNLGPASPPTLLVMAMVGDLHRQAGDPAKAGEVFRACMQLATSSEPPQLAIVYQCELGLGWCHAALGDFAAAERSFLRCLETFDDAERASPNKGSLVRADPDLVALYQLTKRPELAAKYDSEHSRARAPDPSVGPR